MEKSGKFQVSAQPKSENFFLRRRNRAKAD